MPADKTLLDQAAQAHYVERHFHNRERWYGKSADQSGNDWALEASLTPFRAISGNGDYGSQDNDEAKVFGTDDTPIFANELHFDFHRILVIDQSATSPYVLRVIWGTGTMADAIAAGQYCLVMVIANSALGPVAGGAPFDSMMPKVDIDAKVWVQCKNATDNATIDFFVGAHGYND